MSIKVDQISSVQQNLIKETPREIKPDGENNLKKTKGSSLGEPGFYKEAEDKKRISLLEEFADRIADKRAKELNDRQKQELMEKLKKKINRLLSQWNIQLDFSIDKDLDKVIVKVKDRDTGKIIRQIPPEEMLRIAKSLEEVSGLLLDLWG